MGQCGVIEYILHTVETHRRWVLVQEEMLQNDSGWRSTRYALDTSPIGVTLSGKREGTNRIMHTLDLILANFIRS